jgi:hypothetical protein
MWAEVHALTAARARERREANYGGWDQDLALHGQPPLRRLLL